VDPISADDGDCRVAALKKATARTKRRHSASARDATRRDFGRLWSVTPVVMSYNSDMTTSFLKRCRVRLVLVLFLIAMFALGAMTRGATAAEPKTPADAPAKANQVMTRGVDFLRQAQADDGSYSAASGPGITAIVATALLRSGLTPSDPAVAKSLQYLLQFVHDDGGIYGEGSRYKNYETSLTIVCLKEANRDGKYDKLLAAAEKFVKKEQWDEGEDQEVSSMSYGGAGYGSHSRPDLSNTAFLIDALHELGAGEDDPAMKKALIFVSRSQNLESEFNTSPYAAKVNDGGFYYTPAAGGQSQAGTTPDGGLRSYGSMTYAGLKSMIYAGVSKDDPRVKAAYKWIQDHYTLEENPGMGDSGLYYYYHTFAKALATIGDDHVADSDGKSHDWRAELAAELAEKQQKDGSWVNTNARWLEGDPNLVTAYSLLALSYCEPQKTAKISPPVDHILPAVREAVRPKR
jgi:squalene-hopene/tetraprenyl-beta-curcumene cyclase